MVFFIIPLPLIRFRIEDYEFKIGLSWSESFKLHCSALLGPIIALILMTGGVIFYFYGYPWNQETGYLTEKIGMFYGLRFLLPTTILACIQIACTAFSIFAWTRNNIRYIWWRYCLSFYSSLTRFAYKDVFFLTVFFKITRIIWSSVTIAFCFSPSTAGVMITTRLIQFNNDNTF